MYHFAKFTFYSSKLKQLIYDNNSPVKNN